MTPQEESASAGAIDVERLGRAAERYQAAEWALRLHEEEPRMTPEHNARVEEWRFADSELRAVLKVLWNSPAAALSGNPDRGMKPEIVEVPVTVRLRLGWHEPGPSVIYVTPEQNRALGPVQNCLDAGVLADVLTELHLRQGGFCSESHRDEAEAIADLYASRDGETLYQDRNAGERAR